MSTQFTGKTVIISGGAGGIGLALAKEFGANGMNVVIADIDQVQLKAAEESLSEDNVNVLACHLDVTDFEQWKKVVSATKERFEKVHMLINNAGVGGVPSKAEESNHDAWRWVIDVNLMGVVYGAQAAIPALKEHGEGGWIVNVASMAGMSGTPYADSYCATKAAVVSLSESWGGELKPFGIQVSALCPAFVKTQIHQSHRNMQDRYKAGFKTFGATKDSSAALVGAAGLVESGIAPELLAKRVVEALESGQRYIFTHPNWGAHVAKRSKMLDKAFTDASNSPLVGHLIDDDATSM
jgi:NAD(P)-dependent dehydrogenase (short-subunit alcohol dehydrogenase family)